MSYTEKNRTEVTTDSSFLFLADVHLGAFTDKENTRIEKDLIALIDFCEEQQITPVILGDFFDYWMEYADQPPPLGEQVLARFKRFHQSTNSHTLYITGNHDNWTGNYLTSLGFDVEGEYRVIETSGMTIMVMHGDGLSDPALHFPRPAMHRFLRNSYFVQIYQALLPPRLGWYCMKKFSGSSKVTSRSAKDKNNEDRLNAWAQHYVLQNDAIQAVIYGHHHKKYLWQQNGATCMNPGSFGTERSVGLYTNKKFQIVTWDAGNRMLISDQTEIFKQNEE